VSLADIPVLGISSLAIATALYVNTSPARMQMAKENVERVLMKLWREGRLSATGDHSEPAKLPATGYIMRLKNGIRWSPLDRFYKHEGLITHKLPYAVEEEESALADDEGADEREVAAAVAASKL
jgi:hypothetical protein